MHYPLLAAFVHWLASTHVSIYLGTVKWMWPLCETLHFIGLAVLVGVAGFFDLRLLGFWKHVPVAAIKSFMPWAMAGFALNLMSGAIFLTIAPSQYFYSGTWWMKVLFLLLAGTNALVFETRLSARMVSLEPGEDSPAAFKAVGAISLTSWFFVLYFGRMLPFLGIAY